MTRAASRAAPVAARVLAWQRRHGRRGLPWQGLRDPYRVWLSEVMLQQTQVATAAAYYERFVARYREVAALATAPLDDVLALWSGLGYYSRARNLHRCAQAVLAQHGGEFPRTSAELAQLPGIGRSTAAAIAAFCFDERAAILDGNVERVLARYSGFAVDLATTAARRELWTYAESLLPERAADMPAYTQGLMDLGATVCLARQPLCDACPLSERCVARIGGRTAELPLRLRRRRRGQRSHVLLWLRHRDDVLLWRRPERGVWAGLWSLPQFDDLRAARAAAARWPGRCRALPQIHHVLTHFDWQLLPLRVELPPRTAAARRESIAAELDGRWIDATAALRMSLPAPVRKLLAAGAA
ncbi:MAG TPA: A/G-specific adenine glycosylase [Burkholderiaceae bacterium]|nr:A/G-specific adenine glycosylase [Burkholderiaceae bacterium]